MYQRVTTRSAPDDPGAERVAIRTLFSVATAFAIVLVAGAPAFAAPAFAAPGMVIDPASGPPLATIKVTGSGFCMSPCSAVTIEIGLLIVESNVPVDSAGQFTTFVQVPDTTRPPVAPVIASQTDAGGNLIQTRRSFTVTVSQPPPVVYPPPSSIPAPTASPLTGPSPSTASPQPTAASTAPASSPSASTTTHRLPTHAVGANAAEDSGLRDGALIAVAGAILAVAGAIWWRTRRARRSMP